MRKNPLIYIPDYDIKWPEKTDKRLPDHQKMLPLVKENATKWELIQSIGKRRPYMFQKDWIFYIPYLKAWCVIRANFVHDWASIPRILQGITSADGILAGGAVPHDHGYRFKGLFLSYNMHGPFFFIEFERKKLDLIFREHNTWYNKLPKINQIAYLLLRIFGRFNWKPQDIRTVNWNEPIESLTGM